MKPILVCGIPRSGTTWLGQILSQSPNVNYVHEPDDEKKYFSAFKLKENMHRFPYLTRKDKNIYYKKLWFNAFWGQERVRPMDRNDYLYKILKKLFFLSPCSIEKDICRKCNMSKSYFFKKNKKERENKNIIIIKKKILSYFTFLFFLNNFHHHKGNRNIVKSVHSILALDWIQHNFDVDIVIILRHPANVISSYIKMKFNDSIRNIFSQKRLISDYFVSYDDIINNKNTNTIIERMTMQIGAFYHIIQKQMQSNPNWIIIKHEDLCKNPFDMSMDIYEKLNLKWDQNVENYIEKHNKKGEGMEINRIAINQITKYNKLLKKEQIHKISKIYSYFDNVFYNKF